ncbi:MAG: hypothetical protein JWP71_1906 [Mucilaginibacter sp.]|nr:hypothetical protein [Mucilaginibacter sp.]
MKVIQHSKYFCFIILILLSARTLAQRINVNPTILSFNGSTGQSATQILTVTNLSDKVQAYQLSLGDWIRDTTGEHRYFTPGSTKRSCANWVSFDSPVIEVEPQKSRDVRVTLNVPADVMATKEMKWAMIFIQNVKEQTGDDNKGGKMKATIKEIYRIGIHVYQTPPNVTKKEAKAISLVQNKVNKDLYDFTMVNSGMTMLDCKVRLVLTNLASGNEIKLEEQSFPVFPEGTRLVKLEIPKTVPTGKYSMLGILEYDPDMPLEAIESSLEKN